MEALRHATSALTTDHLLAAGQLDDYLVLVAILCLTIYFPYYKWSSKDPYHHVWFEIPQADLLAENELQVSTRDVGLKLSETV